MSVVETRPSPPLISLRPPLSRTVISRNRTVLRLDEDGHVLGGQTGLFVDQTRLLSRYRWSVNGRPLQPAGLSRVEQDSWRGFYIVFPPGARAGEKDPGSGQVNENTQRTVDLRLWRRVGDGLREEVSLENFSGESAAFRLELEVDGDFADQAELRFGRRQFGRLRRSWKRTGAGAGELTLDYSARHAFRHGGRSGVARIRRAAALRAEGPCGPLFRRGRLVFPVRLKPRERLRFVVTVSAVIDGEPRFLPGDTPSVPLTRFGAAVNGDLTPLVLSALERARADIGALRLESRRDGSAWTVAAGVPLYVALFGRDTLTAAWQAAMLGPDLMRGTLRTLADWQGRRREDWRDEQPGRMLHEAHSGPLEALQYNPRARSYGSVTTTGFFPVAVSELWHWTGDKALARSLLAPTLKALDWLDRYGDIDGDGFYEYRTRSSQGTKHQAWKDSSDALVYEDGTPVEPPIATCEEQAFVYLAKLHASELLWWLGDRSDARRLFRQARELRLRFNERFWLPRANFFAMGLDADKRPIASIGSNAGHCLAAAIAEDWAVRPVAERLMAPDMFSGWGVRTLSAGHPAYNPYSYHRGSVWPVEQATFALGFMRYGLHGAMERLCRAQFEAAALFEHNRLPELFGGQARADVPFPALYPQANSPQAWSASAPVCLLQSLLGLYPYAPFRLLLVDPRLPSWLPDITLEGLRVGDARVSIRFFRTKDGRSDYRVQDLRGSLRVVRQPSPWSLTAGPAERLRDLAGSFRPGR